MNERQELISEISDTYKSLNGFRPRWNFSAWTTEQLREFRAELQQDVEREIAEEKAAKEKELAALNPSPAWTIGELVTLANS